MTQPVPTPPPGDPAPTAPATPPADPAPPAVDEPLREPGKRALEEERARVKELERQVAKLAPLPTLLGGAAPTGDGKTDLELLTERFTRHEQELASERAARFRAEVAANKGLTAQQAARLQGNTREELEADADALIALFPAAATPPPARTPVEALRPGALPNGGGPSVADQIAEMKAKGDIWGAVALERSKLNNIERPR